MTHKYGMSANGSKLEKALGELLKGRVLAGELKDLREQVRVRVCCNRDTCPHDEKIEYIADFAATDVKSGELVFYESKGFEDPRWRLKRRLWKHTQPHKLEIWKGSYKKIYLDEVIIPKGVK